MLRMSGVADEAGKNLNTQINAHRALGWRYIELRSIEGTPLDLLSMEQLENAANVIEAAGLSINCIASRLGNWQRSIDYDFASEITELEKIARFCQLTGCRQVRIMSYLNSHYSEQVWRDKVIKRIADLASRAHALGLILVHENCSGWGGRSIANMVELVSTINSPALAILYDIGNGLSYGYDSIELLHAVLPWVRHVHIKDGIKNNGQVIYTLPGQGQAKVAECVRYLADHDYDGLFSIEPHIDLIPHLQTTSANNKDMQATYITYGRAASALINSILNPAIHHA